MSGQNNTTIMFCEKGHFILRFCQVICNEYTFNTMENQRQVRYLPTQQHGTGIAVDHVIYLHTYLSQKCEKSSQKIGNMYQFYLCLQAQFQNLIFWAPNPTLTAMDHLPSQHDLEGVGLIFKYCKCTVNQAVIQTYSVLLEYCQLIFFQRI